MLQVSAFLLACPLASSPTEVSTIEVDFNGVEPGITPLSLKVFAVNGSGNSLTRTLALQRSLPTAPTALVLKDEDISTTAAVTKVGPYTGKATSLTLTATPFLTQGAEATSFKWVLPDGVNVIAGADEVADEIKPEIMRCPEEFDELKQDVILYEVPKTERYIIIYDIDDDEINPIEESIYKFNDDTDNIGYAIHNNNYNCIFNKNKTIYF